MGQTILYSSTKQSSKVVCDSKPWISPLTDNWSSYSLSSSLAYTAAYNATWSLSYYTCTQIVQSTTRIGVGGLWYVDKQKASSQCKYVGSCLSWKVHLHTCNLIISFVGIQIKNLCCFCRRLNMQPTILPDNLDVDLVPVCQPQTASQSGDTVSPKFSSTEDWFAWTMSWRLPVKLKTYRPKSYTVGSHLLF